MASFIVATISCSLAGLKITPVVYFFHLPYSQTNKNSLLLYKAF